MTTMNRQTDAEYIAECAANEVREAAESRDKLIANLRAYAELLEQHPDLPAPASMHMTAYVSAEQARAGRKGIPGWSKYNTKTSYYATYTLVIGSGDDYRSDVNVALEVAKADTCTKVKTGVKHVPEYHVEAHDEDTFEWRCGSGPGDDAETE